MSQKESKVGWCLGFFFFFFFFFFLLNISGIAGRVKEWSPEVSPGPFYNGHQSFEGHASFARLEFFFFF